MKFDVEILGREIEKNIPEVDFALLHGSSADGEVKSGSDIDIAVWLNTENSLKLYNSIFTAVEKTCLCGKIDIGFLNKSDVVYRFEALKGKLLFARDIELYQGFYSLTCRLYENQMYRYEYQNRITREARGCF